MGSISVADVKQLNSRIESIHTQKTRSESKIEVLKKQLDNELESYEETFGVSLKDKSFAVVKAKVKKELETVTKVVKEEYELKEEVVNAIESGDYSRAYKLLGIKHEEPVEEVQETENIEIPEPEVDMGVDIDSVLGNTDDTDIIIEEPEVETKDNIKIGSPVMLDEEDQKPAVTKKVSSTGSKVVSTVINHKPATEIKGTSVAEAFDDMVMGDDPIFEEDDTQDFGFGEILQGTKFDA